MAVILVGKQETTFPTQDGNKMHGLNIHVIDEVPVHTDYMDGQTTEKLFVWDQKVSYGAMKALPLGSKIVLIRNKRGKYDDFIPLDSKESSVK